MKTNTRRNAHTLLSASHLFMIVNYKELNEKSEDFKELDMG